MLVQVKLSFSFLSWSSNTQKYSFQNSSSKELQMLRTSELPWLKADNWVKDLFVKSKN